MNYGTAEGKDVLARTWGNSLEEEMEERYLFLFMCEKFLGGESFDDLEECTKKAITHLVLPHVWKAAKEGSTGIHVAVVSHGLCLGIMISELLKMSGKQITDGDYDGLENTAWTHVVINTEVYMVGWMVVHKTNILQGAQESKLIAVNKDPLLVMHMTNINHHLHIDIIIWHLF
jgi:broad specificity phosphatase PhoE